jgi:hypothetical protein
VEESRLLGTYLTEAEAWMSMVGGLMASVRAALECSGEWDACEMWNAERARVLLCGLEEEMAKVKRALGDGLELGLDLPGISELETLFNVNAWSIRALHVLESRPVLEVMVVQRPGLWRMELIVGVVSVLECYEWCCCEMGRRVGCDCWSGVLLMEDDRVVCGEQVAKRLLDEGSSLSPRTRPWVLLQREIGKAESWKRVVEMVVPSYGKARSCSRQQLEQLLREAKVRCGVGLMASLMVVVWGHVRFSSDGYACSRVHFSVTHGAVAVILNGPGR